MKNRKLLRVGTPIKLTKLNALLNTLDDDDTTDAIVSHRNGELIVEAPQPTLGDAEDHLEDD